MTEQTTLRDLPVVNHALHMVVTILTFGFWSLPWLMMALNEHQRNTRALVQEMRIANQLASAPRR